MNNEIWLKVPGHEDYEVSNMGVVKSLKYGRELIRKASVGKKGYLYMRLDGVCLLVHQIVCMAFFGHRRDGMKKVIDHINSDKKDNRLSNLRIVDNRENVSRICEKPNKSSKYTGVYWHKKSAKWNSRIKINGKTKHLGLFIDETQASKAYQYAVEKLRDNNGVYSEATETFF